MTNDLNKEEKVKLAVDIAIKLIKKYEGFSAKPYLCPANVWTIGYGNTRYLNKQPVTKLDQSISEQEAEQLLANTLLTEFLPKVLESSPVLEQHENKLAAVLSFAYNLGTGAYSKSTLRKLIDKKQYDQAQHEFIKWVNAGGKKLNGLVKRRAEEAALFMK